MPFDGITAARSAEELNALLAGGRIRKIQQPEADELRLTVNKDRTNTVLLISASPNNARIHITSQKKENPAVPPSFCMSLRKYISGSEITAIVQQGSDRIVEVVLNSRDEFGEPVERKLICEITGRNSNIILTAGTAEGTIITDALKKVGFSSSRYRQILPGNPYIAPPSDGRNQAGAVDKKELLQMFETYKELDPERFIITHFFGLSPAFAREVLYRAGLEGGTKLMTYSDEQLENLADAFIGFYREAQTPAPAIYMKDGDLIDFYPARLTYLGAETKEEPTVSTMLEEFYSLRDRRMRFRTKSANLRHQLENLRKRDAKKLQYFDADFKRLESNDRNKLYGDLITANIWMLERGMKKAELPDYSDPEGRSVVVPLKVNETPSQNAQRFYKKYAKGKRAAVELDVQKKQAEEELYYIESLLESLKNSTENTELDEIRHEFAQSDLASKTRGSSKGGPKKPAASKPMHFVSSEGFDIYVGKNNYQNDYISTRLGVDEDCWLHVKDAPGSHVLIVADGKFITEATVLEGGMLAAWYSSLRGSENIPVDYLEFKYLKKPKKAKPGMVIFTNQNTMFVTPDKATISAIEKSAQAE
ncbi:MAG: Rqc2 family fibronectin-binding protein [Eubacteriaceae bacterium]|jgi:predicted ribosome quality control (RQC) complex YloA/Tae2 family protein